MVWFSKNKSKKQNEIEELRNKTINIGVKGICSIEMSSSEKESIVTDVIKSIRKNFPDKIQDSMYQLAKRSYKYQIENFKSNTKLHELIKVRYEIFNRLNSYDNLDDYGIINLLEYSIMQAGFVKDQSQVKITSYSTNEDGKYYFTLAGAKYIDLSALQVIKSLSRGDNLSLVAEPDNPYDGNAIAVYHNNEKLGYIPQEVICDMKTHSDEPAIYFECFFSKASDHEIPFISVNCYPKKPI